MKFTGRFKWKRIVLAVLCLSGLLAVARGSYAAYTSQAFQRGIARNRDNETVRFTSNYLQSCASGTEETAYAGKTVLFGADEKKEENTLTIDLYIYNYVNGNANLISQKDITYNLTISFEEGKGQDYHVKENNLEIQPGSDNTYEINGRTLTGRVANFHKYTLTFPGNDLDSLKIRAVATPTNLSVTNNQILAAVIAPCTGSKTNDFRFEGKFTDESGEVAQYDGFNYEISISTGKAEAVLTWDADKLEIDQFFLKNLNKTTDEITAILESGTLTLEMDQDNGTGDYVIPFYKKGQMPSSWDEMKKLISFTATKKET